MISKARLNTEPGTGAIGAVMAIEGGGGGAVEEVAGGGGPISAYVQVNMPSGLVFSERRGPTTD